MIEASELSRRYGSSEFDLASLIGTAERILAERGLAIPDGRAADRPDPRLLRYYQGIGIVSRPLRYERRQAVYGFRHLLEILAAKTLQARGLTLAQIQRALIGKPARALLAILEGAGASAPPAARPAEAGDRWIRIALPGGGIAFIPEGAPSSMDPQEAGRALAEALDRRKRDVLER